MIAHEGRVWSQHIQKFRRLVGLRTRQQRVPEENRVISIFFRIHDSPQCLGIAVDITDRQNLHAPGLFATADFGKLPLYEPHPLSVLGEFQCDVNNYQKREAAQQVCGRQFANARSCPY